MTAINLNQQQALDADKRKMQQINFTENQAGDGNANKTILFYYSRRKKNYFRFFTKNCEGIINLFLYIIIDDLKLKW